MSEKVRRLASEHSRLDSIPREQPQFPTMGVPRRIAVKGMQGVDARVIVTVVQDAVWLSISPPFTWEAIMEPGKVDEVIHVLELARYEATKEAAASIGSAPRAGSVVRAITGNTANP